MQVNIAPDLETLIQRRLSSGAYLSAEDVVRRALEAQDAEERELSAAVGAMAAHVEAGYRQAERGELLGSDQARREIQALKDQWRASRRGSADPVR